MFSDRWFLGERLALAMVPSKRTGGGGNFALMSMACRLGYVELARKLLRVGFDFGTGGVGVLEHAAGRDLTDVLGVLLKIDGASPSVNGNYKNWQVVRGQLEIVKLLLKGKRVDPSARDNEAILYAAQFGHTEIVELLLKDPRVDPSANRNAAIRRAAENGHVGIVELLLKDPRVDPSARDNEAIQRAAFSGHLEVVELLLKHPDVDPRAGDD
ncbi:MAG: ankyrin repeat domain-containing protein, partial [Candidatus Latescibacterota bacterium]